MKYEEVRISKDIGQVHLFKASISVILRKFHGDDPSQIKPNSQNKKAVVDTND